MTFSTLKHSTQRLRRTALAVGLTALALGVTHLHAETALPPVHHSGSVQYLSGGVGDGEASAIQGASKQWPLTLEFAIKTAHGAEYAADVAVQVLNAHGQTALDTRAQGPFLLAKLAPGAYTVEATLGGKTLHQQVVVKAGQPAKAVMVWPAGTDKTPA
ncbi:MAG: hypothetical protein ABIP34_21280 [Rhodoferax sp.]|uniref:hypothetical protein n=1 Tax=Rhodoferax sp. TaxID=50421 RepID=UPI003267257F